MAFKIDGEILESAIKTVTRVVGSGATESAVHCSLLSSHTLEIQATSKESGLSLKIPCKVIEKDKKETFAIDPSTLLSAISKKKELEIGILAGSIKVSSNRYKAELVTSSLEREEVLPKEVRTGEKKSIKVSQNVMEFIRQNIAAVELKPLLESYDQLPVAVRINGKGALMVCYDLWHMAFAKDKKVVGDMSFLLPLNSLSILARDFKDKSYKMRITDSALYAYNEVFELFLTLPQQDEQNTIPREKVFKTAVSIREQKGVPVLFPVSELQTTIANLAAVHKKGEYVSFQVDKTSCKMTLKSTHGKVTSEIKCRSPKPIEFRTGFIFLKDILPKISGKKVEIQVIPDRMLFFTKGRKTFMVALMGDEGK